MKRSAAASRVISPVRSSVVRQTRDTRETITIALIKKAAIFTPSGRSMMLTTVVKANTPAIRQKAAAAAADRVRQTAKVTATAAEVITTKTPVAYAPPCASTPALKRIVTTKAIAV